MLHSRPANVVGKRTWTDEQAQAFRKRRDGGESVASIAASSGYSDKTVYTMVGGSQRPHPTAWTAEDAKVFRERYDNGERVASLAASSPFSENQVYRMLNSVGPPVGPKAREERRNRVCWTDAQQQAAKKAYEANKSIRQIEALTGFSFGTVRRMLAAAGGELRRRGGTKVRTEDEAQEYRRRYEAGESVASIARSSLYGETIVREVLREAGTTFRRGKARAVPWTDSEAEAFKVRYEAKESVASIAASSPYTVPVVYKMLHHAGAKIRHGRPRNRPAVRPLNLTLPRPVTPTGTGEQE